MRSRMRSGVPAEQIEEIKGAKGGQRASRDHTPSYSGGKLEQYESNKESSAPVKACRASAVRRSSDNKARLDSLDPTVSGGIL
jgi:hypothetical protein